MFQRMLVKDLLVIRVSMNLVVVSGTTTSANILCIMGSSLYSNLLAVSLTSRVWCLYLVSYKLLPFLPRYLGILSRCLHLPIPGFFVPCYVGCSSALSVGTRLVWSLAHFISFSSKLIVTRSWCHSLILAVCLAPELGCYHLCLVLYFWCSNSPSSFLWASSCKGFQSLDNHCNSM